MARSDSFAQLFSRWRREILLGLVVFLYLLGIALRRGTYAAEDALSLAEIVVFTLLPLVVGASSRSKAGIAGGMLVASMVPFQKTIALVFVVGILVIIPMVLRSGNIKTVLKDTAVRFFLLFTGWLLLIWIVRLGDTTDGWSFPILFGSMLSIPLFYLLLFHGFEWSSAELTEMRRMFVTLLLSQSAVVIIYPLLIGHPVLYLAGANGLLKGFNVLFNLGLQLPYADPDWNRGTLVDSHQLGFLLAILTALFFASAHYLRRKTLFIAGVVGIYLFGITETSHAVPAFITGLLLAVTAAFLMHRAVRLRVLAPFLFVCIALFPPLLTATIYGGDTLLSGTKKSLLYRGTIEQFQQNPIALMFGFGPATFGSRVANKRLPEGYDRLEHPFPILVGERVAPAYAAALKYSERGSSGTTAQVQASGLVSILAESGIVGTMLFFLFVVTLGKRLLTTMSTDNEPAVKSLAATGLFSIVLIAGSLCFRQYLEYPQIMSFVWLLVLLPGSGDSNKSC